LAPVAAAAVFDAANQAWLDAAWKVITAAPAGTQDAGSANLPGRSIVTGNWWQP
jgi:hypothetical protein